MQKNNNDNLLNYTYNLLRTYINNRLKIVKDDNQNVIHGFYYLDENDKNNYGQKKIFHISFEETYIELFIYARTFYGESDIGVTVAVLEDLLEILKKRFGMPDYLYHEKVSEYYLEDIREMFLHWSLTKSIDSVYNALGKKVQNYEIHRLHVNQTNLSDICGLSRKSIFCLENPSMYPKSFLKILDKYIDEYTSYKLYLSTLNLNLLKDEEIAKAHVSEIPFTRKRKSDND